MAQRVRGRSPLTQGKKRYSRKINRKARARGRPMEVGGGLSPPPQALAENRWAGGRDALRLHTVCASPGGRKGAPDERSDWWVLTAHHRPLWWGTGGHPHSLVVLYKSNHSRLKRLRSNYENFWFQNSHPLT